LGQLGVGATSAWSPQGSKWERAISLTASSPEQPTQRTNQKLTFLITIFKCSADKYSSIKNKVVVTVSLSYSSSSFKLSLHLNYKFRVLARIKLDYRLYRNQVNVNESCIKVEHG
jgi:hypothetical protein